MILTGRAKEDFLKWFDNYSQEHHHKEWLENDLYLDEVYLPSTILHALIIEWFDSVGYHIGIDPHIGGGVDVYYAKIVYRMPNFIDTWVYVENTMYNPIELHFESRQQATKQAILKANEIYNEQFSR